MIVYFYLNNVPQTQFFESYCVFKLLGVSFQKGLGAVHGLSEPLGATFNTQHGLTNAVILPWVLKDLQMMASTNTGGKQL